MSTKEIAQNMNGIIQAAFDKSPTDAQHAFNSVMQSKMADALETRQQEIATNMFGADNVGEDQ